MNQQIKSSIGITIIVVLAIIAGAFMWMKIKDAGVVDNGNTNRVNLDNIKKSKSEQNLGQRMCTQETKQCADGSYVSRTGPNCEFEECPVGKVGIANPASVFCEDNGGKLEIRTGSDGGQIGYCKFSDGSECEEWKYFRSECKSGDSLVVNTTDDWHKYKNDKYGFTLTFPETWKGFATKNRMLDWGSDGKSDSIDFGFAAQDSLFNISFHTKKQYDALSSSGAPFGTKLGEKNGIVFVWNQAQYSEDSMKARYAEISDIIKTFKFTK